MKQHLKKVAIITAILSNSFVSLAAVAQSVGNEIHRPNSGNIAPNTLISQAFNNPSITEVTHNGTSGLFAGETFQASLRGTPNQKATFWLVEFTRAGKDITEVPATEISAGFYQFSVIVPQNTVGEIVLLGRLQNAGSVAYESAKLPAYFGQRPQSGTLGSTSTASPSIQNPTTTVNLTPTFISHKNGDLIASPNNGFKIRGMTRPWANVAVKVGLSKSSNSFGNVLSTILFGDEILNQTIQADSTGAFEIDVPKPSVEKKGRKYQVEATASYQGQKSQTVKLELIQN